MTQTKSIPEPKTIAAAVLAVSILTLGACDRGPAEGDETARPSPSPEKPVSIFRPEAEVVPVEAALKPLDASVSFAQGGKELSDQAKQQLATIIETPQMKAGGAITLRGHTDSAGNDEANLRASRQRAQVVEGYLVDNGIAPDRIEIIALGEMRPVAPNAKLDGTPDEDGRAANRRVDVIIAVPGAPDTAPAADGDAADAAPGSPTLVETITAPN